MFHQSLNPCQGCLGLKSARNSCCEASKENSALLGKQDSCLDGSAISGVANLTKPGQDADEKQMSPIESQDPSGFHSTLLLIVIVGSVRVVIIKALTESFDHPLLITLFMGVGMMLGLPFVFDELRSKGMSSLLRPAFIGLLDVANFGITFAAFQYLGASIGDAAGRISSVVMVVMVSMLFRGRRINYAQCLGIAFCLAAISLTGMASSTNGSFKDLWMNPGLPLMFLAKGIVCTVQDVLTEVLLQDHDYSINYLMGVQGAAGAVGILILAIGGHLAGIFHPWTRPFGWDMSPLINLPYRPPAMILVATMVVATYFKNALDQAGMKSHSAQTVQMFKNLQSLGVWLMTHCAYLMSGGTTGTPWTGIQSFLQLAVMGLLLVGVTLYQCNNKTDGRIRDQKPAP